MRVARCIKIHFPCNECRLGIKFALFLKKVHMKTAKLLIFIAIMPFFLTGCSSVKVRYDKNTNFNRYKTFAYVKPVKERRGIPPEYQRIIVRSVDRYIRSIPLMPDAKHPDVLVRIEMDFHKRIDVYNDFHHRGMAVRKRKSYEGVVEIVFIDAATKDVIWTGWFPLRFANERELKYQLERQLRKLRRKYPVPLVEAYIH